MTKMGEIKQEEAATAGDPLQALIERAAIFRLLAHGFVYPKEGDRPLLAAAMRNMAQHAGVAGSDWSALQEAWQNGDDERLVQEYMRLFLGSAPCSLHETAYGDGQRLAGKSRELADIRGFYKAFAMTLSEDEPHLPDHLATELEFYSVLLLKQAYALEEGWQEPLAIAADAARTFMDYHLGRWVNAFVTVVQEQQAEEPYRLLAEVTAAVVGAECDRLGVHPELLSGRIAGDVMQEDALVCPRDVVVAE
jgi:TorA maturation chaperone TorD